MEDVRTTEFAYDLPCGATLILFTQDTASGSTSASSIAEEVSGLLSWLGTPSGFTVYLWMRDDPRVLEADSWPSRRTVNGGFAYPGKPAIFVYRAEEYQRVILHETIHALRWDWDMPEKPLPCWGFKKTDVVSPHLFEAWTELYAEWLYCGYYNVSWTKQRKWQIYQATQILARVKDNWTENTNVFAYYVLKAALAPHISFLWIAGNGQTQKERAYVLCQLVEPELRRLKEIAQTVQVERFSLRMTTL
jgi:hypothetical protein